MYLPKANDSMDMFMGTNVIEKLKQHGTDIAVYPTAKIVHPENVSIDDHTRLCDFVFIHPGFGEVRIGRFCDFEPYSLIWGAGVLNIGDFVNFGPGTKIMGNRYEYREGDISVGTVEQTHKGIIECDMVIEDHVYFGTDVTVLADVHRIGEGAFIGAQTLVNRDLEPWGIYVGSPARKIGERPRGAIEKVIEYGLSRE